MFKSAGHFRDIQCPVGSRCNLFNCIFAHNEETRVSKNNIPHGQFKSNEIPAGVVVQGEPPLKKQKLDDGGVRLEGEKANGTDSATSTSGRPKSASKPVKSSDRVDTHNVDVTTRRGSISPPPIRNTGKSLQDQSRKRSATDTSSDSTAVKKIRTEPKTEMLNPRLLPKPPAIHTVRLKLLKLIHEQMERLNAELMKSKDTYWKEQIGLSRQAVITLALDEEEKSAKANSAVYANVLKLRIVALKKMTLEAWKAERMKALKEKEDRKEKASLKTVSLDTGLSSQEEITMLPQFFSSQEGLGKHGYIVTPPTEADIEQARKGIESAGGWEVCDRCTSRFQVFPGRRESDGALTSGGKCTYHWGRLRAPDKKPGEIGRRDKQYTCCTGEMGTPGCVSADTHVFKVSEAKRLASIMQFETTVVKGPSPVASNAVCFDCEMGYTTLGMELIRLTATSWPDGKELIDILVRPIGEVLDLNSRFSGVWPKEYTNAIPFKSGSDEKEKTSQDSEGWLQIVDSPTEARKLLFSRLTTTTPLIGHAIENDLNAARIVHPTIIDTVLLYPHPAGLPVRYGLKNLAKKFLNLDIQMGGERGHDSKEDARAAGDLVRFKVAEKWKAMKKEGWAVVAGVFNPPPVVEK